MGVGIMQGRLGPPEDDRYQSFPRQSWREEFGRAAEAGLSAIEWIWDAYGQDANPLSDQSGIGEMRALSERYGIAVRSVCADYFMDYPLVHVDGQDLRSRVDALKWLIERCAAAAIGRIVLPFVDASRMESPEDCGRVVSILRTILPAAERANVEFHLETALPPPSFAAMLRDLPHPLVRVNYDSGNSASLGYRPADEFAAYGARVGSVHIKDRVLGGGSVPLGTGDADFRSLANELRKVGYGGDFILQAARGSDGNEVAWSRENRLFAEAHGFVGAGP